MPKTPHVLIRHGQSLLTGEPVVFVESTPPAEARSLIIRRVLGWPTRTTYPTERCEALTNETQGTV